MNNTTSINTEPFSVYSLPRPFRIAFLLTPDESKYKILDSIIEYNSKVWGGRFNPIIPIINQNIPDNYWDLLQSTDPDIIYLFDDISEHTRLKIIKKIQPLQIITHRNSDNVHIDLSINQITVNFIIKKISNSTLWDSYKENIIPISNVFDETERKLHKLIFRNFCIEDDKLNGRHYSKIFKTEEIKENDLVENFFGTFTSSKNYIFPIQLCAIDINSHFIHGPSQYEDFCIIIEESIWSYILFWNRPLYQSYYSRSRVNQLCLPINYFEKNGTSFKNLASFIHGGLKQLYGGHNQIQVLSTSLLNTEQQKKISEFCKYLNSSPNFIHQDPLNIPKLNSYLRDIDSIPETIHQKVDKLKTNLSIATPIFFKKKSFNDPIFQYNYNWMIDYKIEYRPEKFKFTNVRYWWILNKRPNLTRLFFRYSTARINNEGLISVKIDSNKKDIELSIPHDYTLFRAIILNEIDFDHEKEKKVLQPYYKYVQVSDKGRYLLPTINLFENVLDANFIYETCFWRNFFEERCKVNTHKDVKKLEEIKNWIRKHIERFVQDYSSSNDRQLEYLARYILKTSKELKEQRIYFTYKELKELALSLIKESSSKSNNSSDEILYLDDLRHTFNSLVNQSIFLQGIKPRCPICGSSFWYGLEEVTENIKCKGCYNIFRVPFDIEWTFKINELIVNSLSYHGVFPVIWCINELYHYAKNLIYNPAIDLYKNESEKEEVDLVLLMDNKLTVCEIKTHMKEFDKKEIEKIKRIALNVEADKIVLGGFYGDRDELEKISEKLRTELSSNGIEISTLSPHETTFKKNPYF